MINAMFLLKLHLTSKSRWEQYMNREVAILSKLLATRHHVGVIQMKGG
jgi:hypothetical protein